MSKESVADKTIDILMDEYSKEFERLNSLDNKSNFCMTIIVLVATIFVPVIPFKNIIVTYQSGSCNIICITTIAIVALIIAFGYLVGAFTKFMRAFKLKEYEHVNLDYTYELYDAKYNKDYVISLCMQINDILKKNRTQNDKKCEAIEMGYMCFEKGLVLLMVSSVVLLITIGG